MSQERQLRGRCDRCAGPDGERRPTTGIRGPDRDALDTRRSTLQPGQEVATGSDTSGYTSHRILADGFGAGYDAPLVLVAQLPPSGADLTPVVEAVRTTPGVASVTPPRVSQDRAAAVFIAYPTTAYQDPATPALVHRLREDVLPAVACKPP